MTGLDVDIRNPDPRLRPFPDAGEVFADDQAWLARHLHPLVSIDLAAIEPSWQGWLHLLSPLEPHEGYVGDHSTAFHDRYARENWLAFRRDGDGRYRFLGRRDYFLLEQDAAGADADAMRLRDGLKAHYAAQQAAYEASRQRYARCGVLTFADDDDPSQRSSSGGEGHLLDQLGGTTGYANWTVCPDPPDAFELDTRDEDDVFPRWKDGAAFRFIASVSGYPWQHSGADAILLFYEPQSDTVLLTFDWS